MPKIEFYKPKKDTREKLTILEISWKLNLNFLLEYLRIHDPPPDLFRIRVQLREVASPCTRLLLDIPALPIDRSERTPHAPPLRIMWTLCLIGCERAFVGWRVVRPRYCRLFNFARSLRSSPLFRTFQFKSNREREGERERESGRRTGLRRSLCVVERVVSQKGLR